MNKIQKYGYSSKIIFVIIISLIVIFAYIPLGLLLEQLSIDWIQNHLIGLSKMISKIILFVLLLYTITKFELIRFNGLHNIKRVKDPILVIRIGIVTIVGIALVFGRYLEGDLITVWFFILGNIFIGLAEEFMFRGLLLPLFICLLIQRGEKRVLMKAVLYSSLLFGFIHYINLISVPDNFEGVTFQVLFAIGVGVFLAGVMLRTGNIFFTSLVHALINIILNNRAVLDYSGTGATGNTELSTLLLILFTYLTVFFFSFRLIRNLSIKDLNLGIAKFDLVDDSLNIKQLVKIKGRPNISTIKQDQV